jgi:hypothetical protein
MNKMLLDQADRNKQELTDQAARYDRLLSELKDQNMNEMNTI